MNRLFWLLLGLIAVNAHADEAAILDKDFRIMMAWFPGVYDNQDRCTLRRSRALMKPCVMSGFTMCLRRSTYRLW